MEDTELLRRAQAGDGVAFNALYERHIAVTSRVAARLVREPATAEEVAQDAFVALWRGGYDPRRGTVLSLLLTITRHRAIDVLRRQQRRVEHHAAELEQANQIADGTDVPHEVHQREQTRMLRTLLSHLPATQRQALELSYYAGLSQAEIARRLGEPLGTIKSRARLGLDGLRLALPATAAR